MPARDPSGKPYKGGTYRPPKRKKAKPRPVAKSIPEQRTGPVPKPRVKPITTPSKPKLSGTPHEQLKRSGELDKKGRQKALVKQKPRKKSERKRFIRTHDGIKLVSQREYRRRVRESRETVVRNRRLALTRYGDDRLSAKADDDGIDIGPLKLDLGKAAKDTISRTMPFVPLVEEGKKKLPEPVKRELEGRGEVAKLAEKLKRTTLSDERLMASGVTAPGAGPLARDALDIATQAIPSTYLTADAVKGAAEGDTRKLERMWRDYKATSAIPAAVEGDFKEAVRRLKEHPLSTVLEVSGAKAAVGRTAGGAMRSTPGRGKVARKVRKAASTERADLRLYPKELDTEPRNLRDIPPDERRRAKTGPRVERRYSRDVFNKAVQKTGEKIKRVRRRDPDVAYPRPSLLSLEAPVRRRLLRQVDTDIFAGEGIRRRRRSEAVRETTKLAPPEHEPIATVLARSDVKPSWAIAVQLAAEGVIRRPKTFRADLEEELARLGREYPKAQKVSKQVARENRAQQKAIRRILEDEDVKPGRIFKAAREFRRQEGERQERLQGLGQYTDAEADARFMPFAQSHMGARTRGRGKGTISERLVVERPKETLEDRIDIKATEKALQRHERRTGEEIRLRKRVKRTGSPEAQAMVASRRSKTRPLTRKEIKEAAAREGIDPAFITQRRLRTRSAMYVPTMRGSGPPTPTTRRRSGRSFELGAREVGGEQMVRQAAMSEGMATAVENFNALTNKFGIAPRRDGGYANTWNEAVRMGRELTEDAEGNLKRGHVPLVPVNVAPFRTLGEKIDRIHENARPGANVDDLVADAFSDAVRIAFDQPTSGKGKFVLMPEDVVERIREHQFRRTRGERSAEALTGTFRDVVLTTSSPTTWLLGNVTDLGVRSVLAGLRPTDIVRGRRVVERAKAIDRRRGEEIEQSLTGGGLYHAGSRSTVHRPTRIGESRAVRYSVMVPAYRAWRDAVFAVEKVIEELPQYAAVGKAMREDTRVAASLKGLLKLADEQVETYARDLTTNRAMEARVQKATEDIIGRWGKVSPSMRRLLGIAPFAQWLAAATRYTFVTLPAHHPIKTALIAGMYEMTDKERRKLGLTLKGDPSGRVQDYQQGSIPLAVTKGKYGPEIVGLGTQRLTSFGTAGAFPENVGEFAFPQIKSALLASLGVAWTGEELVYPDGHPKAGQPLPREERRKIGVGLLLEGLVPFAGMGRRIMEGGRPSDPTSTILDPETRKQWDKEARRYGEREGSTADAIRDWLDPTRRGRLYTEGDIAAIEKAKRHGQTFEDLRKEREAKKDGEEPFWNLGDDGRRPTVRPKRSDDGYWDLGPSKPKVRPKRSDDGYWNLP